jgi:hypothetical protein
MVMTKWSSVEFQKRDQANRILRAELLGWQDRPVPDLERKPPEWEDGTRSGRVPLIRAVHSADPACGMKPGTTVPVLWISG